MSKGPFKLKRGDNPTFKDLGSSSLKTHHHPPYADAANKEMSDEQVAELSKSFPGLASGRADMTTSPIEGMLFRGAGAIGRFLSNPLGSVKPSYLNPKSYTHPKQDIRTGQWNNPISQSIDNTKTFIQNNPEIAIGVGAYYGGNKLHDIFKNITIPQQAETAVEVDKIFKKKKQEIYKEKVGEISKSMGMSVPELENQRTDWYVKYNKKIDPKWKPKYEQGDSNVNIVSNYTIPTSEMSTNLRKKGGEYYSSKFNLVETTLNDIYETAGADTNKAMNMWKKHREKLIPPPINTLQFLRDKK
tara:strand:+ start:327 stop:1229 length:903 start_codon:yes stop_codon:yes gene_type:complete